jgi:outer membrane protein assembly factor BamE (lipoprotein component of BamABCDE complex)
MMAGGAALFGCSRPDPWVEGTDFPRPTVDSLPLGTPQPQFEAAFGAPFTRQEHLGGGSPGTFMYSGGAQYLPMLPPDAQVDDRILNYIYRINMPDDTGHNLRAYKTLYAGFRDGRLAYWDYHSNRTDASGTRFNADAVAELKRGETTLAQAVSLLGQPSTLHLAWTIPPGTTLLPGRLVKPFAYTSTALRYEMTVDEPGNKQVDTTLFLLFDPSGRLRSADLQKQEHEKQAFPQPFVPAPTTVFIPVHAAHR